MVKRDGLFWGLPDVTNDTWGKIGPGFGYGVGCGVGIGVGLVGGLGLGFGFPGMNVGLGVGAGCGIGAGFGYGFGQGTAWDRGGKYTNMGERSVRRLDDSRRHLPKNLPPGLEDLSTLLNAVYREVVKTVSDDKGRNGW